MLTLALWVLPIEEACAATSVVVEVHEPTTDDALDAQLVQRLVRLELSDVDVPLPVWAETQSVRAGLYVRVLVLEAIVVELWDRGEIRGQRRLSRSENAQLNARRVALASGELARRLREQRLAEIRVERERLERASMSTPGPSGVPLYASLGLSGELHAASVAGRVLWAGPRLFTHLSFAERVDVGLAAGALFGVTPGIEGLERAQWLELGVQVGYRLPLTAQHVLRLGGTAAPSLVRLDHRGWIEGEGRNGWSARAGVDASWLWEPSQDWSTLLAVETGVILRPLELRTQQDRTMLSGVWLGLRLGLQLDHLLP